MYFVGRKDINFQRQEAKSYRLKVWVPTKINIAWPRLSPCNSTPTATPSSDVLENPLPLLRPPGEGCMV